MAKQEIPDTLDALCDKIAAHRKKKTDEFNAKSMPCPHCGYKCVIDEHRQVTVCIHTFVDIEMLMRTGSNRFLKAIDNDHE